jgi:hypothetical protein
MKLRCCRKQTHNHPVLTPYCDKWETNVSVLIPTPVQMVIERFRCTLSVDHPNSVETFLQPANPLHSTDAPIPRRQGFYYLSDNLYATGGYSSVCYTDCAFVRTCKLLFALQAKKRHPIPLARISTSLIGRIHLWKDNLLAF